MWPYTPITNNECYGFDTTKPIINKERYVCVTVQTRHYPTKSVMGPISRGSAAYIYVSESGQHGFR